MRTLAEKRLIEDRAPTLDGSWMQRIMDARSANGNFLHSTMTPFSSSCGMSGVHGNLCTWGVARMGWRDRRASNLFDKKLYLAAYYLGTRDLQADLAAPDGILERLKHKVSRDDLYYTWLANWSNGQALPGNSVDPATIQGLNRPRLWEYLLAEKLLRVMVVVAGVGPHAAGMPELDLSSAEPASLASMAVLVTDGRVSFGHNGISIGHLVPEALDGGPLGSVRTGDWIYMDLTHGELQVVRELKRHKGFRPLSPKDLMNRPDRRKRIHELQRQRLDILPSIRLLLDHVSSAEAGVSPMNKV
jgi:dihydroxyacid dehydratase/phosphogluconate dehydratase